MNVLNLYERFVLSSLVWLAQKRQRHYWNKIFAKHIQSLSGEALSGEEKKQALSFYRPFFKIKITAHEFYKRATGSFHHNYMPDDMYYAYIEPFYNNWEMAKYMDNKCLYRNMFPGAKQPSLMAYRCNGLWYSDLEGGGYLTR